MSRIRVFLPVVLMAAWPFVGFASHNARDFVNFGLVLKYGLMFNAAVVLVAILGMALLRRQPPARIAVTVAVGAAAFFLFGYAESFVLQWFGVGRFRYSLALWGVVFLALVAAAWRLSRGRHAVTLLSVAAGVAVLVPAFELAQYFATRQESGAPPAAAAPAATRSANANVYFVLFDEYGRADQILDAFGFDETPFLDALRSRGFRVLERSHSNLPMTHLSLSTTLSMDYVVPVGKGALNGFYGYKSILRGYNKVVERFRALGYHYIHAQPGRWEGSRCGGGEDLCIKGRSPHALQETEVALLGMTPLSPIAWKLFPDSMKYGRIQFPDVVGRLKTFPRPPYFLYAHLLQPHDLQLNADCSPAVIDDVQRFRDHVWGTLTEAGKALYVNTIRCIDRQILEGVETIIEADPEAIVILQADHGFALGDTFTKPLGEWTETDFSRRFGIFNVMRLPPRCRSMLYPSLSPVNTFRVVFACLEGRPADLVADRSYVASYNNPDIKLIREFPRPPLSR